MNPNFFIGAALCLFLFSTIGHAQQTNTLFGIGANLGTKDGYIVVNSIVKGGPADLSGQIHPQDQILGIGQGRNGKIEDITGRSVADSTALIRGEKGTVVRLQVLPGGNGPAKIVELVRDEIKLPEPTAEQLQQQQAAVVQQRIADQIRGHQSPRTRFLLEAHNLADSRSTWGENGSWLTMRTLIKADGDAELGFTEDQKQELSALFTGGDLSEDYRQRMGHNPTPEYLLVRDTFMALNRRPDDPLFERATEEEKIAYQEAHMAFTNLWMADLQAKIQETLSPEQMLQVRNLERQLMSELGIPFPSMFEPLDLTEEQKKEMKEIADELKAEFDSLTREVAELHAEQRMSALKLLEEMSFTSMDEFNKARDDVIRRYVPTEEMRKRAADLHERGKKLVATLQNRLMDVLTDEQLDKMQKILDETPEFAKRILARFKAARAEQEKSPTFVPGPNSWRPGDPVPGQFKEERRSRASRRVNE
jgi:hypothetical protein